MISHGDDANRTLTNDRGKLTDTISAVEVYTTLSVQICHVRCTRIRTRMCAFLHRFGIWHETAGTRRPGGGERAAAGCRALRIYSAAHLFRKRKRVSLYIFEGMHVIIDTRPCQVGQVQLGQRARPRPRLWTLCQRSSQALSRRGAAHANAAPSPIQA